MPDMECRIALTTIAADKDNALLYQVLNGMYKILSDTFTVAFYMYNHHKYTFSGIPSMVWHNKYRSHCNSLPQRDNQYHYMGIRIIYTPI